MVDKLKVNNWTNELRISKEYISSKGIIKLIKILLMNTITAVDNKVTNKEPAPTLIDKRLARVKDWKRLENDSIIYNINKNNSILVRNIYSNNATKVKPK